MLYTLTTAAQAVGRTRQAIQAAIAKGLISAKKDAFGHWQIEPAELHRVYAPINQTLSNDDKQIDMVAVLEAKLLAAENMVQTIKQQADELRVERDAWKEQSHQWMVMSMKALPGPDEQPKKRSFLSRLFSSKD